MTQLDETTIKSLQESLIGKRISVIRSSDNVKIAGICKFIGYNKFFPNWNLQVTIDRLPIRNVELSKIELIS